MKIITPAGSGRPTARANDIPQAAKAPSPCQILRCLHQIPPRRRPRPAEAMPAAPPLQVASARRSSSKALMTHSHARPFCRRNPYARINNVATRPGRR